jgi:hypothetical protein
MGAYDNPAIIRDRSAEIYGQAAASFGSAIGKGIMNYSQSKAQQRKEADEQNLKDRNIFLEIELAYEKDHQENLNLAKKSETPMLDSFEKSAKNLLNGTKDAIGAKQARYELMTKKNLNEKEKEERLKIVNNYQTFMGDAKFNMGSMIAEKEEYFNFTRSDLNRKFSFKGSGIERTRNMFTYLALNNNSAPEGVTYEKRLYAGPNGENMVYAKTTFDENSATFKNLSKFDQDEIRKNGMSLVFDQNWNDWRKEGFLTEILQGLDPEKMQESIKFKDDSGGLTADFSTNLSLQVRSEGGKDITSQQNIVNTPLLLENLYEPASNRASVIMDATPQEQDDYIAFTLGRKGSDFDRNKTKIGPNGETFQEMLNSGAAMEFITKETQELFLEDNLTRGFGKDKRGYVKRKATKQQAAALNRLNKNIEGFDGSDIQEGDDVYVKDTDISMVKSDTNDSDYTKTQVANSIKVNKNWTKNKSVLKGVFNSLTAPGSTQPPVKTVMADFAKANISAMPIYGENNQLVGYELKNQLVSTKPATILINESPQSINQAIKVASGLSYSIGTEWDDLIPDEFSMYEE